MLRPVGWATVPIDAVKLLHEVASRPICTIHHRLPDRQPKKQSGGSLVLRSCGRLGLGEAYRRVIGLGHDDSGGIRSGRRKTCSKPETTTELTRPKRPRLQYLDMNPDRYYLADQEIKLDTPDAKYKLTQRLRQYLELRNVSILPGNGCSIPLGAPVLNDTRKVKPEIQTEPYKLSNSQQQQQALALLDLLLPGNSPPISVEAFLGVLGNIISNTQSLPTTTTFQVNNTPVTRQEANALDNLLKKWLYHRCLQISDPPEDKITHHRSLPVASC